MNKVYTFISPELLEKDFVLNKIVVVVDILRATSTIHYALLSGVSKILPQTDVKQCLKQFNNKTLLVGEKSGKLIKGYQFMNSPFAFAYKEYKGYNMCFCSTNGTKAILATDNSNETLIGSFLNIKTLTSYLLKKKKDLIILCSGWKGNMSYEDFLFSGQLIHNLKSNYIISGDSSIFAHNMFLNLTEKPINHLKKLALLGVLSGVNEKEDIVLALKEDVGDILPFYKDGVISL